MVEHTIFWTSASVTVSNTAFASLDTRPGKRHGFSDEKRIFSLQSRLRRPKKKRDVVLEHAET